MQAPSDACITRGMPRQHARARLCVRHHVATTWPPAQDAHEPTALLLRTLSQLSGVMTTLHSMPNLLR